MTKKTFRQWSVFPIVWEQTTDRANLNQLIKFLAYKCNWNRAVIQFEIDLMA